MDPLSKKNKTPEKEINELEITNISDAEFKTLVTGMLNELTEYGNSIKKTQEDHGWYGSVDSVLPHEPKGRQFDSQSGHMPGLWARSGPQ